MVIFKNKKEVEASYKKFSNSANDLINSSYNTFSSNLKNFLSLCENDKKISPIIDDIKELNLDFDSWYNNSMNTVGSMVGSGKLAFPEEEKEKMYIIYSLLRKVNNGDIEIISFSLKFLARNRYDKVQDYIIYFNEEITKRFVVFISQKLEEVLNKKEILSTIASFFVRKK